MAEMKVQGRIPVVVPDHLDGAVAAGNSPRVKAKLVDALVYLIGVFITFGIPRLLVSVQPGAATIPDNSWSAVLIVFWPLFGIIFITAYALLSMFWVSREGQTPGMKIAAIRWIRLDDGARGGSSSVRKFSLEVISGLLTAGLFPLVVWLTSQGEVNRTWFDRMCGTLTISLSDGVDPSATMGRSEAMGRKRRVSVSSTSEDSGAERRYALSARPDSVLAQDVDVIGDVPSIGAPAEEMGAESAPLTSIPIEMSRDYDDIRHSLEQARKEAAEHDALQQALQAALQDAGQDAVPTTSASHAFSEPPSRSEPSAEKTGVESRGEKEPSAEEGSVFAPQTVAPPHDHLAPLEIELEPDIDLTTVRGVPLIPSATTHDSDEGLGAFERTLGFRPVGSIRLVFDDGTRYDLIGGAIIGRDPVVPETEPFLRRLSVVDPSRSVSKTHLKVTVQGEAVLVEDLHSTNGTRITPPTGDSRSLIPGNPELAEPGSSVVFGRRTFVIGG